MSYSDSFPATRPVFQFNADAGRVSPNMTFSRPDSPINGSNAPASAVHYWSNEKHLSSENLLLDSKTGTANWTGDSSGAALVPVVTANHATSPDGTASQATRVQLDLNGSTTGSDYARYYQTYNVASGTSATFAVWMKSTDGASSYAAQILSPAGPGEAVTITGSWQKFTVTGNSVGNITYGVRLRGGQTPTNADTADILIWGANLSTTGQTVLSETTTQIHREYAPTLKSVATAGQPRFEYDPTDGQSMGCLIESQATNLNPYSDALASWPTSGDVTLTSNASLGPDGTLGADLMVANTNNTGHYVRSSGITVSASTSYTLSGYFKSVNGEKVRLSFFRGSSPYTGEASVKFTLSGSGSVSASTGSGTITSVGNGWYRCTATGTTLTTNSLIQVSTVSTGDAQDYAGNAYNGVLCAGIQFESGSFASSLVSTSGATATRAADSMSVATADIGYTGGPVTGIVDAVNIGTANYPTFATITDSTGDQRVMVQGSATSSIVETYVKSDGTQVAGPQSTLNTAASKVGFRSDTNNFATVVNGGTVATDTSGPIPASASTLHIGQNHNSQYQINGNIKRIAIYGEALSDTNLISLTS